MEDKLLNTDNIQREILSLLAYFDIFAHPLLAEDFFRLKRMETKDFYSNMNALLEKEICYQYDRYYSLRPDVHKWVEKRNKEEVAASDYWDKAYKNAKRIAGFPFVRGVAISGSLSKGVMTKDADIDYFIITEENRLWLARTMLILYKKIRLLNSRKYFCVNYFVDTNNLTIIDKNIFTAVEVAHLIPVFEQDEVFKSFFNANEWVRDYVNYPAPITQHADTKNLPDGIRNPNVIQRKKARLEKMLSGKMGGGLENWTHQKTLKRWMRKFRHFDKSKFELTMRSTKGVSKHHPQDFQSKVLDAHRDRLDALLERLKTTTA